MEKYRSIICILLVTGSGGVIKNKLYKLINKEEELYNLSVRVIKDGAESIGII